MKKWMIFMLLGLLISGCASTGHDGGALSAKVEMQQGVRLATKAMKQFDGLEQLLEQTPAHIVSGNGNLPCERHDQTLWMIEGGNERDVIDCSWGSEIILTQGGNDQVNASWGRDALHGGAGDDTLNGGRRNDVVYGGAGNDIIKGGWGNEVINGGSGNDQIKTGWGKAVLLYGKGWGHDTVEMVCSGAVVVLLFSKEISQDDLVWSNQSLVDTKTHSKITFPDSTRCLKTVYSNDSFQ